MLTDCVAEATPHLLEGIEIRPNDIRPIHGSIVRKTSNDVFTISWYESGGHVQYSVLCIMLYVRTEDAFVITCVANLMEVKVLYVQQDLRYEISSYWRFNV
jgi:hypothetical protein